MPAKLKSLCLLHPFLFLSVITHAQKAITLQGLESLKSISGLALSPDGSMIAFQQGGMVKLRSVRDGEEINDVGQGFSVIWSPPGDSIAINSSVRTTGELSTYSTLSQTAGITVFHLFLLKITAIMSDRIRYLSYRLYLIIAGLLMANIFMLLY